MRRLVFVAFVLLSAAAASAQSYPDHPIRVIVPTPPGGPVDVMARLLCNSLSSHLGGQTLVVENKPGAGNIIGSKLAAEAKPDGYTLHVSSVSGLVLSPMIHKNPGYSAASFDPIILVTETPQVLVVNAQSQFKSVADLLAYAKAHPGKLNYSSGGIGTFPNLTAELFKKITGTNIVHVPYKGGHLALNAVLAGETELTFDTLPTSLPLVKASKLRAIAISGKVRVPEMPDVPNMQELGYPQLTTGAWTAFVAPKGTPPAILAKLNAAANAALHSEPMKGTLAKMGADARGGTPKELANYISEETAKWKPLIADLHIMVN